jgi:cellulose synthase/poly-beta-1,6-N-acetylglucosamine synthase-like glycosyltransferase
VCGNQKYQALADSESSGAGERLYWAYDKWLKKQQTRGGNIVAADGAIYAIRRELFESPATAAVTDDFAISTAVVRRGKRLVFEAEALAYEPEADKAAAEFQRKVRIVVRGLRGVLMRRALLNPFRYGFYSIVLFSHKVLRRTAPLFLILAFVSSGILAFGSASFRWFFSLQLLFYGLAGLGFLTRTRGAGRLKLLYAPFHYCLVNGAALVALVKVLRGTRIETWQPQRRRAVG